LDEKILFYLSIYPFLFILIHRFVAFHPFSSLTHIYICKSYFGFLSRTHVLFFIHFFTNLSLLPALCFFHTQLLEFFIHLCPFIFLCLSISISFTYFWGFHPFCPLFIHSFIYPFFFLTYLSCFHLCSLFPFTYLSIFFHCIYYFILPSVTFLIQTIYFNSLFSSSILLFHPNCYHSFFSLHLSFGSPIYLLIFFITTIIYQNRVFWFLIVLVLNFDTRLDTQRGFGVVSDTHLTLV
jgi:hypothetical protein